MFRSGLAMCMVVVVVALFAGCGDSVDPAVLAQRAKYLLTDEPAGALGVIEIRNQLGGEQEEHGHEAEASAPQQPEQASAGEETKPQDPGHTEKGEHNGQGHDHGHDHALELGKTFTAVGRIGGVPNPWDEGKATFMIVDNSTNDASEQDHDGHNHEGHDHAAHSDPGHDPETCPFCKQNKNNSKALAIVQFEDERGKVLGVDARKLFDVSRNQTVVVRGKASFDDLGNLVISASGLYIRE